MIGWDNCLFIGILTFVGFSVFAGKFMGTPSPAIEDLLFNLAEVQVLPTRQV